MNVTDDRQICDSKNPNVTYSCSGNELICLSFLLTSSHHQSTKLSAQSNLSWDCCCHTLSSTLHHTGAFSSNGTVFRFLFCSSVL